MQAIRISIGRITVSINKVGQRGLLLRLIFLILLWLKKRNVMIIWLKRNEVFCIIETNNINWRECVSQAMKTNNYRFSFDLWCGYCWHNHHLLPLRKWWQLLEPLLSVAQTQEERWGFRSSGDERLVIYSEVKMMCDLEEKLQVVMFRCWGEGGLVWLS